MVFSPPRMPARESIPFNLFKVTKPGIARVRETVRVTPESQDEVRHIVVDLGGLKYNYLEGQSLGVLPPGLDAKGKPHKLRLYSIASTRFGDDHHQNTATLCVKRALYPNPDGTVYRGVCSNYLCDLPVGAELKITGPAGKAFLLPEDPNANLIMIATGTGIAPFRGFLKYIYEDRQDWKGQVILIFGAKFQSELLYIDEFEKFLGRPGYQLWTTRSREQTTADGKRLYVQHRIAEHADEVWGLLQHDQTYTYICGLKGMEAGIIEVLQSHAERIGVNWDEFYAAWDSASRLLVETY